MSTIGIVLLHDLYFFNLPFVFMLGILAVYEDFTSGFQVFIRGLYLVVRILIRNTLGKIRIVIVCYDDILILIDMFSVCDPYYEPICLSSIFPVRTMVLKGKWCFCSYLFIYSIANFGQ